MPTNPKEPPRAAKSILPKSVLPKSPKLALEDMFYLVIDDQAFVRHIVTEALKTFGVEQIAVAQDGLEAHALLNQMSPKVDDADLKSLLQNRPDIAGDIFPAVADFTVEKRYCVITDYKMPGANGLQLLKAIRCGETKIPRDSPVIMLTSFAEDYIVYAALLLDVHAFVVKPISRNMLKAKIERALKADMQIKTVKMYEAVKIPDEGQAAQDAKKKATANAADIRADDDDEIEWILVGSVQPGAVLARDLTSEHGALLLKRGSTLSPATIDRLKDAQEMKAFNGKIPIYGKAAQ